MKSRKISVTSICEKHFDFKGELCPVCMDEEIEILKKDNMAMRKALIAAKAFHEKFGYPVGSGSIPVYKKIEAALSAQQDKQGGVV